MENTFEDFMAEAQLMLDLNHKNVMSLIGVTYYKTLTTIVLPYMNGHDLRNYITRNEPRVRDLIEYGIQIARGKF